MFGGNKKFFLGTDTAPHFASDKENCCGCAGIFNATYCLSVLAQIFDNKNKIFNLEKFVSINGAKHYNLKTNDEKIKIVKYTKQLNFKKHIFVNKQKIHIFDPKFPVFWNVL